MLIMQNDKKWDFALIINKHKTNMCLFLTFF